MPTSGITGSNRAATLDVYCDGTDVDSGHYGNTGGSITINPPPPMPPGAPGIGSNQFALTHYGCGIGFDTALVWTAATGSVTGYEWEIKYVDTLAVARQASGSTSGLSASYVNHTTSVDSNGGAFEAVLWRVRATGPGGPGPWAIWPKSGGEWIGSTYTEGCG